MTVFWTDEERGVEWTYERLVEELRSRDERRPVVYESDPLEVKLQLLLAVLSREQLTLLDAEFPTETIREIGYDPATVDETTPVSVEIETVDDLRDRLAATPDEWRLDLCTSGTTGTPEPVTQSFEGLTRSVRTGERFTDDVWAFAYNPTHFAGLQVLFQAVLNCNQMVYVFERSPSGIETDIRRHGITHVSATPTFYRLRLCRLESQCETVRRLTSGGERFEPSLRDKLSTLFPNAEFRNVYALTEAGSLLESDGETFRIPDRYTDRMRVDDDGELLIHQSLVTDETTAELNGEWFHTGDLVEFTDEDRFRFVARESDFVNVGGYRVNPHEVERRIADADGVTAATVTARESSVTGNILVAEVVPDPSTDPEAAVAAAEEAVSSLERWKQPRIVEPVEQLAESRSGKRIR